jgi:cell division transport system ATP-binding protein
MIFMEQLINYSGVELHRNHIVVLKNINLTVNTGELVYLTGKVGSGKSSFLKSLYAEIPIAAGKADVLGRDMVTIKRKEIPFLRREIGIVFQDFRLLSDRNVYDNLMFVLDATGWKDKAEKCERLEQVLRDVGMLNKSYKMPQELSGGEQQRIVMARAMLNHPRLILADEPTGNLDPETGSKIMKRFHEIAESGTAVIVATHNISLVKQYPARELKCFDKHIEEK